MNVILKNIYSILLVAALFTIPAMLYAWGIYQILKRSSYNRSPRIQKGGRRDRTRLGKINLLSHVDYQN